MHGAHAVKLTTEMSRAAMDLYARNAPTRDGPSLDRSRARLPRVGSCVTAPQDALWAHDGFDTASDSDAHGAVGDRRVCSPIVIGQPRRQRVPQ